MRRALWVVMIVAIGCNGPTENAVDDDQAQEMIVETDDSNEPTEEAAEAQPDPLQGEELRAWLAGEALGETLRVPVAVESSPLGVTGAWIYGGQDPGDEAPGLAVRLDDTRLGIGLADRLRSLCDQERCTVWIRATVGETGGPTGPAGPGGLAGPGETAGDDRITLILSDVEGVVDEEKPTVSIVE